MDSCACTCAKDREATCILHPTTRSLKGYISKLEAKNEALEDKYNDLLLQVANKVPGETRHESARRIISQHENQHGAEAALAKCGEVESGE